mmetsp:Transcript_108796/g.307632  ORF Transcript_108796/g.307632 Transcript_108796/m.307632 type:complete len:214 (-) Transcript_108796:244-885(-)
MYCCGGPSFGAGGAGRRSTRRPLQGSACRGSQSSTPAAWLPAGSRALMPMLRSVARTRGPGGRTSSWPGPRPTRRAARPGSPTRTTRQSSWQARWWSSQDTGGTRSTTTLTQWALPRSTATTGSCSAAWPTCWTGAGSRPALGASSWRGWRASPRGRRSTRLWGLRWRCASPRPPGWPRSTSAGSRQGCALPVERSPTPDCPGHRCGQPGART